MTALCGFHPVIARWFRRRIGEPTVVQEDSWREIAAGAHVLITAPTGSGKTLAAFLWALNQLATGQLSTGHTSVLYVSPLKALNNDIRRNLLGPLAELRAAFEDSGVTFPGIRVLTRSGDTPQSDRAQMQRHPPEILITTPESLNLMLSSAGGRSMLRGISTVILDEIHAVVGNKRGVHLMTAVERLVLLSGEFQRIALSATMRPLDVVAEFVGGFHMRGGPPRPQYEPRPVSTVSSASAKRYDISVWFPTDSGRADTQESIWEPLAEEFKRVIGRNRSTLLFANSRRLCEKLALKINHGEPEPVAYVHHGALSREIRYEVERRLRDGELRAIIATNSLELGIDIGALDEVLLAQSPPSISSAIQRVGRAGHQVGEVCRGTIFPTHSRDLLEAAVLASGITSQDLEAIHPVRCPLDVLAQVIVSMVGAETWDMDRLYAHLRCSYAYRELPREHFDLVLNMLGGRYVDSRVRQLKPRISVDRVDNTVVARKGALLALYLSGGMIPDRGYFHLRHSETAALIGELDEEFVWEASVGQTFTLGAQGWKIARITHNDVFVAPGNPRIQATPFWRGEENYRDFHFAQRIGEFLETADACLEDDGFRGRLQHDHGMEPAAAEQLVAFLKLQRERTGCSLPHRHHIVVEYTSSGPGGVTGNQLVLHTVWGGRVNRPFAMALDAAWEQRFGQRLETYTGNDCIVIQLPHEVPAAEVLSLVSSTTVESLLRKRLEGSGFFGARFRECAGRALLLPRSRFGERLPLWMTRLRSQKLMESVLGYEDFPILLEAWRTCLQDEFDLEDLGQLLAELEAGAIDWTETRTAYPSPMAQGLSWAQTNQYMYMGDEPAGGTSSRLRGDLLGQVVLRPELRPRIDRNVIEQFEQKRQRLAPGYSPDSARDLVDWVKERVAIPAGEWDRLLQAMKTDHDPDMAELLRSAAARLLRISAPGASQSLVVAAESVHRVIRGLYGSADIPVHSLVAGIAAPSLWDSAGEGDSDELLTVLLSDWLQFYGPRTIEFASDALGVDRQRLSLAIEDMVDAQQVVVGELVSGGTDNEVCDSQNFESLLRLARTSAVPVFEPLPIEALSLLLATHQGLTAPEDTVEGLFRRIEQLLCLPLPAEAWESDVLPARLQPYSTSWLDTIMQEGNLRWIGSANRRVAFCFEPDIDLLSAPAAEGPSAEDETAASAPTPGEAARDVLPDGLGRYDFSTLLRLTKRAPDDLSGRLWEAVWQGRVTNDTFAALRKGIENRFRVPKAAADGFHRPLSARATGGRASFSRWKGSLPSAGNWLRLPPDEATDDPIESEERNKDRARLLLERYGVLFRQLLEREAPDFRWGSLFRALRLMELSGEVLAGYFFHGIPGPQFISHQAFRVIQRRLPEDRVYWLNATDPASLCGLPLDEIRGSLPRRVPGTHLVYCGRSLVMVSGRNAKELTFNVPPEDERLQEYLGFLRHVLGRQFQPIRRVVIERINGAKASSSPYVDALRTAFHVTIDYRNVILYRRNS